MNEQVVLHYHCELSATFLSLTHTHTHTKGVGLDVNDPFEQFRKNKSYTFNKHPPPHGTWDPYATL